MALFDVIYALLTYTAAAFSVLMNASPVLTIRRVERVGSVGPMTVTFFAAQLYNGVTWSSYGAYTWSYPLLISNMLGNAVGTYCVLTFLAVARRQERAGHALQATTYTRSVLTSLVFIAVAAAHLLVTVALCLRGRVATARYVTGWDATVGSIVMLSSPLMMFKTILATRDASSLQPVMVTFAFFNTLLWLIAGCMTGDPFIITPNGLCWIACCAQYALIFLYRGARGDKAPAVVREAIAPVPFD